MTNTITKEQIDQKIKSFSINLNTSARITTVVITMKNGASVVGVDCALNDKKEFDRDMGELRAMNNAYDQIYKLENYLLCERLYSEKLKQEELKTINSLPLVHIQH